MNNEISDDAESSALETNFNKLLDTLTKWDLLDLKRVVEGLKFDRIHKGISYCGFLNAPAAKGVHHARTGGLVQHLLEMFELWKTISSTIATDNKVLTGQNVAATIILHDLHKAYFHFAKDGAEVSGYNYGKHPISSLLTDDQKTMYIVQHYDVKLNAYVLNAVYNSEGGYAKNPPRFQTTLAKIVYILDELSTAINRTKQGNIVDIRSSSVLLESELWQ